MRAKAKIWLSALGLTMCLAAALVAVTGPLASAAEAPVSLGAASGFALLAGDGVSNNGPSVVNGDLGTSPNPAVTGFASIDSGPGVLIGAAHRDDSVAKQAQLDLKNAYTEATGRPGVSLGTADPSGKTQLGGRSVTPGVYKAKSLVLTGPLTLDGQGDPASVFVFQVESGIVFSGDSKVALINNAQACNVFWLDGGPTTLGANSSVKGSVLSMDLVQTNPGAAVEGRLLANVAAVKLDSTVLTSASCAPAAAPPVTVSTAPGPVAAPAAPGPLNASAPSVVLPTLPVAPLAPAQGAARQIPDPVPIVSPLLSTLPLPGGTTTSTPASSANPSKMGQTITLTSTVTANDAGKPAPTGSVTFLDGPLPIGTVTLDAGAQAQMTIATLKPGVHPITAFYLGGLAFTASTSGALQQTVNESLASTNPPLVAAVQAGQPVALATTAVTPAGSGTAAGSAASGTTAKGKLLPRTGPAVPVRSTFALGMSLLLTGLALDQSGKRRDAALVAARITDED